MDFLLRGRFRIGTGYSRDRKWVDCGYTLDEVAGYSGDRNGVDYGYTLDEVAGVLWG